MNINIYDVLFWVVGLVVCALGVVAVLLAGGLWLVKKIMVQANAYNALLDFIWDRAKKKRERGAF